MELEVNTEPVGKAKKWRENRQNMLFTRRSMMKCEFRAGLGSCLDLTGFPSLRVGLGQGNVPVQRLSNDGTMGANGSPRVIPIADSRYSARTTGGVYTSTSAIPVYCIKDSAKDRIASSKTAISPVASHYISTFRVRLSVSVQSQHFWDDPPWHLGGHLCSPGSHWLWVRLATDWVEERSEELTCLRSTSSCTG